MIEPGALEGNPEEPERPAAEPPAGASGGGLDTIPEETSDVDSEISAMMLALQAGMEELEEMNAISREQLHVEALPSGMRHRPLNGQIYVVGEPSGRGPSRRRQRWTEACEATVPRRHSKTHRRQSSP